MSSTRGFPFSFSVEAHSRLGPAVTLNDAVRAAFPALHDGWAHRTAAVFEDGARGPGLALRPGTEIPAGTVLGLFAGTVFAGDAIRSHAVLPLPTDPAGVWDSPFFVDGAARASRVPSAAEAVLYWHACENPTLVGEWWWGGAVPCLIARAARVLRYPAVLSWDFNAHGGPAFAMSPEEAHQWRLAGHRTARCTCAHPDPCPRGRFLRIPDEQDASDDSDW